MYGLEISSPVTSIVTAWSRAISGATIKRAVRNWLDTLPRTAMRCAWMWPRRMRSGGKPCSPVYSICVPTAFSASTRSPIGRSCMRDTPCSV